MLWVQADEQGCGLMAWSRSSGTTRLTPPEVEVGNIVHAYGGGAFAAGPGRIWYVDATDGQLQTLAVQEPNAEPTPLTGGQQAGSGDLIYYDGELLGVQEGEHGDTVTAWDTSNGLARTLLTSSGFLAAPRLAPGRLAWLTWGQDAMPWDSAELWCADYHPGGVPIGAVLVAGGPDEAVAEPRWGPDGSLYFMSDRSGWMNLHRWDGTSVRSVASMDAECAAAPWELGYASYTFLPDHRIAMIARRGTLDQLVLVEQEGVRELELPFTSIKPYMATVGDHVAMIAATPITAPAVVVVDPDGSFVIIAGQSPVPSAPRPTTGHTAGGVTYLLHRPSTSLAGPLPLIVRAHPGPTDGITYRRDAFIDFFTHNGFAIVDVAYRGSTGFGRAFRRSLYGRWGLDDVADCAEVAEHLLATGTTTPGSVFIAGASAGGYTALHAVCAAGPFAAAIARSPIIDPKSWAATVPRFQRAHAVALDGGGGRVRSEAIRKPVLLVHGANDPITSAADTLALAHDLQDRRSSVELLLLDTESHTLSAPHLAEAVLDAELRFLRAMMRSER
ncbi:peptidase [Longispora fulva]|uniref:Poly(3-hydroxybutyrate) depolymerase n=1 Tax=Longispora fulva TaxID=619741 RepID=A0A8J7KJY3_9ACTN|nr:poly(3-hydroxybutyrate) depolymerase [Longispora fulva]GIG55732.1 peptidase [Longispora fulva]